MVVPPVSARFIFYYSIMCAENSVHFCRSCAGHLFHFSIPFSYIPHCFVSLIRGWLIRLGYVKARSFSGLASRNSWTPLIPRSITSTGCSLFIGLLRHRRAALSSLSLSFLYRCCRLARMSTVMWCQNFLTLIIGFRSVRLGKSRIKTFWSRPFLSCHRFRSCLSSLYIFSSVHCSVSVIDVSGISKYSPTYSGSVHSLFENRVNASFESMYPAWP